MNRRPKTAQLQIRVSAADKATIQRAAKQAGMDMSTYVLTRLLSIPALRFQECIAACAALSSPSFALAELNSLLSAWTPGEMRDAVATAPSVALNSHLANYIAAMVEYGCARCSLPAPSWTRAIPPLEKPEFGTRLEGLRLHLLTHSPPPFRQRNIFVDTSLGGQT